MEQEATRNGIYIDHEEEDRKKQGPGRALVERELRLLSKLDHPNLMKVHEAFEDKHKIYFVFDDFKGGTLFDRIIRAGQFCETDAAATSGFLTSLIKYLHGHDIIIRNLRPESIIFEHEKCFDIKLVDLSLALETADYIDNDQDIIFQEFQREAPVFLAPELFTIKKKYTQAVDIWSAGCIIFNMVTGIPPFYESKEKGYSALKS